MDKDLTPYLSVIIPCWNEEKNLENGVLKEVYQFLINQEFRWEVIIIDDGSTDNSRHLIRCFIEDKDNFSLREIPHGGKPAAVWAGIKNARRHIVLFADMDQSTPIDELYRLLPWYDNDFDVVIGSRGMGRKDTALFRSIGGFLFLTLRRFFVLRQLRDTQCGFKTCRRKIALEIFPQLQYSQQKEQPTGWKVSAYDVEFLYLCERAGYRIKETKVKWSNRDCSNTKCQKGGLARYVCEAIEMVQEVIRVKRKQLRGAYDI